MVHIVLIRQRFGSDYNQDKEQMRPGICTLFGFLLYICLHLGDIFFFFCIPKSFSTVDDALHLTVLIKLNCEMRWLRSFIVLFNMQREHSLK